MNLDDRIVGLVDVHAQRVALVRLAQLMASIESENAAENRIVWRAGGSARRIWLTSSPEAHVEHAVGLIEH